MNDDVSFPRPEFRVIKCLVVTAGVMLVTAAVLHLMGRVHWCECGNWTPWSWDIWSQHNSQHLIDPYFFTHVLHGIVLYVLLYGLGKSGPLSHRFLAAVLLEAGWEVLENSTLIIDRYREATISLDYYGDSIANSMFDIVACAAGFLLAARLKPSHSVMFFLVTELLLVLAIRDCLTLNVVMLVRPIDAIKQWQMAL
ncbi:MAG: DUF2585 family protein [Fuerstiella sp.]|jgi:hypothetical protein|nr:DUF2585 family protein [Fuerstiella sp.]